MTEFTQDCCESLLMLRNLANHTRAVEEKRTFPTRRILIPETELVEILEAAQHLVHDATAALADPRGGAGDSDDDDDGSGTRGVRSPALRPRRRSP